MICLKKYPITIFDFIFCYSFQVTSSDRRIVDRARAWCTTIGAAYFRLSPGLSKDVALDETRHDQLIPMLWETKAYVHSHQADLKKIAQLLRT